MRKNQYIFWKKCRLFYCYITWYVDRMREKEYIALTGRATGKVYLAKRYGEKSTGEERKGKY
jgi:hypothetical protein